MSCPAMKPRFDPIADELLDKTLIRYPNHTVYTHLGCVLLRSVIGLLLISSPFTNPKHQKGLRWVIILLMTASILYFGQKYIFNVVAKDITLWKSYPRMLVAYSTALVLIYNKQDHLAGMTIIMDALMGMNSRHTASVVSCGYSKK